MSPTYLVFGSLAVKSHCSTSGTGVAEGSGDGSANLLAQVHSVDADPAHHPLDALVVDVDPGVLQLGWICG
jgi:hypothetical protein